MDYILPGSSIHGIFQARVLEWVAISLSRGSSQPRDRTRVSCIIHRQTVFTVWATTDLTKKTDFWANSPGDKKELGHTGEGRKASVSLKEAERSDSSADVPQEELGADVQRCDHLG